LWSESLNVNLPLGGMQRLSIVILTLQWIFDNS